MVLLQLFRWKFPRKNLCSRLYSIELEFYSQNAKFGFKPPFGGS